MMQVGDMLDDCQSKTAAIRFTVVTVATYPVKAIEDATYLSQRNAGPRVFNTEADTELCVIHKNAYGCAFRRILAGVQDKIAEQNYQRISIT